MSTAASIHALAHDDRARAESAAWARFAAADDASEFSSSWLGILCAQVELARGGLLLLRSGDEGGFGVAAVWPDPAKPMQYLAPTAERTLRERRGVVAAPDGSAAPAEQAGQVGAHIGYPIEVGGELYGAVVLHLAGGREAQLQHALRLLHWGSAWLVDFFRRQQQAEQGTRLDHLTLVSDIYAAAVGEARSALAALAVVNTLTARLPCDRASIGFDQDGEIEVLAISHTATFDRRTNRIRLLGEAMDEVLDLGLAMVYPPPDGDEFGVLAHAALASEAKAVAILSVPLVDHGGAIGVLTLERGAGEAFDDKSIDLCKALGLTLGPVLALQRANERSLWRRLRERVGLGLQVLFGPRHPGAKLAALVLAALFAFLSLTTGAYRVAAKTVIEGAMQRAAVAPFDGYVAESLVRAGDQVRAGQLLARLDDKDLLLDRARWTAERGQLLGKQRQALAVQDRAAMQLLAAQLNQNQAQLALVDSKIERARLVAPFDGVIVSGDLSQLLGTPIEQGKLLFEIAPLKDWRVILQVDERDIDELRVGQTGSMALSGLPHQTMNFSVKQITPVTTAQDGRNHFRVEARIDQPSERLRPGMEGVGKISIGERKLIWIWTHTLTDWFRLASWNWLP